MHSTVTADDRALEELLARARAAQPATPTRPPPSRTLLRRRPDLAEEVDRLAAGGGVARRPRGQRAAARRCATRSSRHATTIRSQAAARLYDAEAPTAR